MKVKVTVVKHTYGFVDIDVPDEEWKAKDTYRKKINIARKYAKEKEKEKEIMWHNWDPLIGYEDYFEERGDDYDEK